MTSYILRKKGANKATKREIRLVAYFCAQKCKNADKELISPQFQGMPDNL